MVKKVSGVITCISLTRKHKLAQLQACWVRYSSVRIKELEQFLKFSLRPTSSSVFWKRWERGKTCLPFMQILIACSSPSHGRVVL
jgi:hypothetical protein